MILNYSLLLGFLGPFGLDFPVEAAVLLRLAGS